MITNILYTHTVIYLEYIYTPIIHYDIRISKLNKSNTYTPLLDYRPIANLISHLKLMKSYSY